MNKKTVLIILGVLALVFLIITGLELILRYAFNSRVEIVNESEYFEKELMKKQEDEKLESALTIILNKLKENDSNYLYGRLDSDYRKHKFSNVKDFDTFLDNFSNSTLWVMNQQVSTKKQNRYIYDYAYSSSNSNFNDLYISYSLDKNNEPTSIIFDNITEINFKNEIVYEDNIRIEFISQVLHTDKEVYRFKLTNNTGKKLDIDLNDTVLNYRLKSSMEISNLTEKISNIELPIGDVVDLELVFPLIKGSFVSEKYLNLYISCDDKLLIHYFLVDGLDSGEFLD